MTSSNASTEIRVAVLGEWVPSQLADVLALQRTEEPETAAALIGGNATAHTQEPPSCGTFDFALSTAACEWSGWVCEPLWQDTLAVAVAKRSHLLAYREVPQCEVRKQPLISAQSTTDEPWYAVARSLFEDEPLRSEQVVSSFDLAMTLVSAGYGIAIAPATRLAGYLRRGVAMRPLAGAPPIVMAYLLRPCASLSDSQERFAQRARSVA
ncbi:MAG: substrate-binding domain-containing protein [Thiomonas sp.]